MRILRISLLSFLVSGLLLGIPGRAFPQPDFEWTDIVETDSLFSSLLLSNAADWLKSFSAKGTDKIIHPVKDSVGLNCSADFEFAVYSQQGVFKKMTGVVRYHLLIEVKDNKYRYTFSDFVFHYYKEDRNYQLKETGKVKSLKEISAPGWQKTWDEHRKATQARIQGQIASLALGMKKKEVKKVVPTAAIKKEW